MTELIIVVAPSFDRRGKRRHERFDARLQGLDEVICEATRQPLLDAGRELLRRGADSAATICMVHASAPALVTMRAPISVAAQYDVMGEKFVRRKPTAGPMPVSRIERDRSDGPRMPSKTEADAEAPHKGSTRATWPTSSPGSLASPPPPSSTSSPANSPASRCRQKGK